MNKTIICNIPMMEQFNPAIYKNCDAGISVSENKVYYPINAYLEKNLLPEESIKVILLVKKNGYGFQERNLNLFKHELEQANACAKVNLSYVILETDFSEDKAIHTELLGKLVDEIPEETDIMADITYGPKDLPIVTFAALRFAEKFLECNIQHIFYGKASFKDNRVEDTQICDMLPLYYLESVTDVIHSMEPQKARAMLKSLLTI